MSENPSALPSDFDKTRFCQIASLRTTPRIPPAGMKPILLTRQRSNVFELIKGFPSKRLSNFI